MRGRRLAATIVAAPNPLDFPSSDQPPLASKAADNDNTIAVELAAAPAIRGWRATRAGSVAHRLLPALIIVGCILTVAWSFALAWMVFRLVF